MKRKPHHLYAALGMALVTSVATSHGQTINAGAGINLENSGLIYNAAPVEGGLSTNLEAAANLVVPVSQLTGVKADGSPLGHSDLVPLKSSSFTAVDSSQNATVIIDAAGVETSALSLVDTGTGNVAPITVNNGEMSVGGQALAQGYALPYQKAFLPPADKMPARLSVAGGTLTRHIGTSVSITIPTLTVSPNKLNAGEIFELYAFAAANGYDFPSVATLTYDAAQGCYVDASGNQFGPFTAQGGLAARGWIGVDSTTGSVIPLTEGSYYRILNPLEAKLPRSVPTLVDAMKLLNAMSELEEIQSPGTRTPVYFVDTNANGAYDAGTDEVLKTGSPDIATIVIDTSSVGNRLFTSEEWEWVARQGHDGQDAVSTYPWGTYRPTSADMMYFMGSGNARTDGYFTSANATPLGIHGMGPGAHFEYTFGGSTSVCVRGGPAWHNSIISWRLDVSDNRSFNTSANATIRVVRGAAAP